MKLNRKLLLLPQVLDMAQALIIAKVATVTELGKVLLPDKPDQTSYTRTHEWVIKRLYPISRAEVVLRLFLWVEDQLVQLEQDLTKRREYKRALESIVCK